MASYIARKKDFHQISYALTLALVRVGRIAANDDLLGSIVAPVAQSTSIVTDAAAVGQPAVETLLTLTPDTTAPVLTEVEPVLPVVEPVIEPEDASASGPRTACRALTRLVRSRLRGMGHNVREPAGDAGS